MEIKRTATIKLSPDELKEIIIDYLAKEGFNVDKKHIDFEVGTVCVGYGIGETEVNKFMGCTVNCELKIKRNE